MVHNLKQEVYPAPEKFWITLETQNILGGVNFLKDGLNEYLSVDFVDINRNPYDTEDPKLRFEIKLIRYVVDSNIGKYVNLEDISELVVCKIFDPEAFEFPNQRYGIHFPTTNTLAIDGDVPFDKRVFETNPIFVVLLFKQ